MKKIGLLVLGLLLCALLYGAGKAESQKEGISDAPQETQPEKQEPKPDTASGTNQPASGGSGSSPGAKPPSSLPKLMVLPFTGTTPSEGENLALLLSADRTLREACTVIPRLSAVSGAVLDHEILRSGLLDTDTIAAIGRQNQADLVITGHIKTLGDRNIILMSVVNVARFQQAAGMYREFQNRKEISLLLSGMAKRLLETLRGTPSSAPALGILPFTIPENIADPEDIAVLVQLLTIDLANTKTYTLVPRTKTVEAILAETPYTAASEPAIIEAVGKALDVQCVLTVDVIRIGKNPALFLTQILDADNLGLRTGAQIEYRTITDGFRFIPELASQLAGVPKASAADQIPDNLVWIAGGSFQMGSSGGDPDETPAHTVQVSGFFLGKTPVTQKEYEAVIGSNPSRNKGEDLPVENVSWYDAIAYCNALSVREGLTPVYSGTINHIVCNFTANGYRLPTEAEWEYAARGGSLDALTFDYAGGGGVDNFAWFRGNSGGQSHKVAGKLPNSLGLYDMSGNVWEWCWDWYGPYQAGNQQNPTGPVSGGDRVTRGGSWNSAGHQARSTYRSLGNPVSRYRDLGFRVLRPVF
ncbi:MAG: SUMF1/EgtB/PvdO family nonheme iron enzyme [Spirochaetaceae bacterium]|jgi:formylglycine-generating enzyme required for sulfatase activity|nr:SUMF1/EgtB/PvdO family nonheme iron enzyme [Spirochaetaceae bacterium]